MAAAALVTFSGSVVKCAVLAAMWSLCAHFVFQGYPEVKVFVMSDSETRPQYCFDEVLIARNSSYVVGRQGKWRKWSVSQGGRGPAKRGAAGGAMRRSGDNVRCKQL